MPRKRRFKRRANSTGSVYKLSGNRRRPYVARATIAIDDYGRPIRKTLQYFATRQEALDFLDMFNLMRKKNGRVQLSDQQAQFVDTDLFDSVKSVMESQKAMLTFGEIFEIVYDEKYQYEKSAKQKRSWFRNFSELHDRRIDSVTLFDLQRIFDEVKKTRGTGTLAHMKTIAADVFEYAVIHQYISRDMDFTSYIDVSVKDSQKKAPKHKAFTVEEVRSIEREGSLESKMCMIYILTGCRPNELLNVDVANIHLDERSSDSGEEMTVSYIITGSKTAAGRNRIVPIHDAIKPYVIELLEMHPDYLIMPGGLKNKTARYQRNVFDPVMDRAGLDSHTPYDCRHTFASLAKLNGMDEFSRKRIMGHKANDLTDDVYTHSYINKLFTEVNRIEI